MLKLKLDAESLIGVALLVAGLIVEFAPLLLLFNFSAFAISIPQIPGAQLILTSAQWGFVILIIGVILILLSHRRRHGSRV